MIKAHILGQSASTHRRQRKKLRRFWNTSNQELLRPISRTSQSMNTRTRGDSCRLRG